MKRSLSWMRVIALLSLVASACTPGTESTATQGSKTATLTRKTPAASSTTRPNQIGIQTESLKGVQILVASAYSGPFEAEFNNQLAEFNTVNPWGIVVYSQPSNSYYSLDETISTTLSGKDQPDLVITLPEQVMDWDSQGKIIDLAPYMEDERYGLDAQTMADFEPIFLAQTWNGRGQLGLPATISTQFLYYNLTWAGELGFKHAPLSSAEFREQACAANQSFRKDSDLQNDGYGGWIVNSNPQAVLAWIRAFGGQVVKDGNYTFTDKANQSALEFLKKLYDDNCAFISTEPTPYAAFAARSALFITADLAEIGYQNLSFEQAGNKDQWTVIPFPGQKNQLVAEGPYYAVLKSTPEKQLAAWLFVRWLLSTENQVSWVKATGLFPLRLSAYGSLIEYGRSHKQWQTASGYMDILSLQPVMASWRKARLVLGDGVESIFRTNVKLDQIPGVLMQMESTVKELMQPTP